MNSAENEKITQKMKDRQAKNKQKRLRVMPILN